MQIQKIIGLLAVTLISIVKAHTVLLPAYGKRCFFETLSKGDELSISFQFGDRSPSSTDQLDGDFVIYGPNDEIVTELSETQHGDVTISAKNAGKHSYCFINERSSVDTKDVTFNIYGTIYVDLDNPETDTVDAAVRQLSKLVHDVKNEQSYIVIRERTHRNTAESTNSRVKYWSIFQLVVVIFNSLFQIYYLKRFFEVTSYV
ncbi:p24 complex component [Hanseniaspora valbyensis]|uniref:GOLD domain-containing protein n=1 Tax=Hanseniaspora valbyensis NRRL Y-1626 TaxID=766949 RepID=A0A1B7TC56_9ASCO|nr:hypothetical protein HANVADRAFT_2852 [Hanseniaspora valbyensis NRRL Y-1626]